MATSFGTSIPAVSIRYLLIDTDGIGSFGIHTSPHADTAWIDSIVGPEGWARVRLSPEWRMAGFVNDCGLMLPDQYPRNIVGSVVLGTFGAGQQPYAGPVVITGWDAGATYRGELEICGLSDAQVDALRRGVTSVRRVLGIEGGVPPHSDPAWIADARAFAEQVRSGPSPTVTMISDLDDVAAFLRQLRGGA